MENSYVGIDPRAKKLWICRALVWTLLVALLSVAGTFVAHEAGKSWGVIASLGALLMLLQLIVGVIWYPRAAYPRWLFRVSRRNIRIRSGLIFQSEVFVPMSKVQHVDVERGPLERRFGLARLILFTAGTKAAKQEIPGLDFGSATGLRDQIAEYLNVEQRDR